MIALLLCLGLLAQPQDPAPAAAGPAQVQWQRSLADALALQQATGKPLLLCVNTEGEMFNDRFAGTVYHDAKFLADTDGYICLIASPERHNDVDHDVDGRRRECPRFPGVTCGEHIALEPLLFERFFHGQRAAPRHVGVAKDGSVLFDRFLDGSMQTAIDAIAAHKGAAEATPLPSTVAGLLQRRDAAARRALEQLYVEAQRASRLVMLAAAGASDCEPFELLRLGLRSSDEALFTAAATALATTATAATRSNVEDALARLEPGALRSALLQRLADLGKNDRGCRRCAAWLAAVTAGQQLLQQEPWRTASTGSVPAAAAPDRDAIESRVDAAERACKQKPDDVDARLELASANLALAECFASGNNSLTEAVFADAGRAAARAEQLMRDDARKAEAQAVQAVVCWQQGDRSKAAAHAAQALQLATARGANGDGTAELLAKALRVEAQGECAAVYAIAEDAEDPGADHVRAAVAALTVLSQHPYGSEQDRLDLGKLLAFVGARREARQALLLALRRHPGSAALHELLRIRIIQDLGGDALLARYRDLVADADDQATMQWFAGYAAIVVAELHVKDGRKPQAETAYSASIDGFAAAVAANDTFADSANHFAVLAHAGRGLLRHERQDADGAVADFTAAVALRPASLNELDGLGRKPIAMLRRVQQELRGAGKVELADRLQALDR